MIAHLKQVVNSAEFNMIRSYLILANIILVVFAIWFSNVGLLPFKNFGDFVFFTILALILGLYRPSWTFAFFVGALVLENINLVPTTLGTSLRPYQFFGFITIMALLVQFFSKRLVFSLPKWKWFDALPLLFVASGILSALGSANKGMSFKQTLIAFSFVSLYFLVRVYIQSFEDAKRALPFFLSSGLIVMLYGIWQNMRFLAGANSFEVMPGRPNSTFTEADWLGIYLVFLLSIIMTIIFYQSKKTIISNFQFPISKKIRIFDSLKFGDWTLFVSCFLFLVILWIVLILTVSRSAWLGAVFVTLVFLKFNLLVNYFEFVSDTHGRWGRLWEILRMRNWQWKKTGMQLILLLISFGAALLISIPLTRFQLGNRAVSTGGMQKITISCKAGPDDMVVVPEKINNISQLADYGCVHINLEDIEKEKNVGRVVLEVYRPDPNVNIRAEIYKKSWEQIRENPILGIGWGSISQILGTDERGAGLNASNLFLETWLGAGLFGFLSITIIFAYLLVVSVKIFLDGNKNSVALAFIMLGWVAIVIPNLFNSGIFLGFVWVYLGIAVSLISEKKTL